MTCQNKDLTSRKYTKWIRSILALHLVNIVSPATAPTLHPGQYFYHLTIFLSHLVYGSPTECNSIPDILPLHCGIMVTLR